MAYTPTTDFEMLSVYPSQSQSTSDLLYHHLSSSLSQSTQDPTSILPYEIIHNILHHVSNIQDNKSVWNIYDVLDQLCNLSIVSKTLSIHAQEFLYHHIYISDSFKFHKFLKFVLEGVHADTLAPFVKVLDFASFSNVGLGRSRADSREIKMLTDETLLECLQKLPNLKDFYANHMIEENLSVNVLQHLFSAPSIRVLDFCGADLEIEMKKGIELRNGGQLEKLSFHEATVTSAFLAQLIPKLTNITHLDLTHSRITTQHLLLLPQTHKLKELSLALCWKVSPDNLVHFLRTKNLDNLEWLNLSYDMLGVTHLDAPVMESLVKALPKSLRYLNVHSSDFSDEHFTLLPPNLTDLGLANTNITFQGLCTYLASHPQVIRIDITAIAKINYHDVLDLVKFFPHLKVIECGEKKYLALGNLLKEPLAKQQYPWVFEKDRQWQPWYGRGRRAKRAWFVCEDQLYVDDDCWFSKKVKFADGGTRGLYRFYAYGK